MASLVSCLPSSSNLCQLPLKLISLHSALTGVVSSRAVVDNSWITESQLLGMEPKMELLTGKSRTVGEEVGEMQGTSKLVVREMCVESPMMPVTPQSLDPVQHRALLLRHLHLLCQPRCLHHHQLQLHLHLLRFQEVIMDNHRARRVKLLIGLGTKVSSVRLSVPYLMQSAPQIFPLEHMEHLQNAIRFTISVR